MHVLLSHALTKHVLRESPRLCSAAEFIRKDMETETISSLQRRFLTVLIPMRCLCMSNDFAFQEAIERGEADQVAHYCAALPPEWLQVRSYAEFLEHVQGENERKHALEAAAKVKSRIQ